MKTPPGSFGLPLIGETLGFMNDPNFVDKRLKKYGYKKLGQIGAAREQNAVFR